MSDTPSITASKVSTWQMADICISVVLIGAILAALLYGTDLALGFTIGVVATNLAQLLRNYFALGTFRITPLFAEE